MSQLTQYIIALTNLYGMVHKDKVAEIYNSQNEDQISLADIEALLNVHFKITSALNLDVIANH